MNDIDQAILDSCDDYDDTEERHMPGLLPAGMRCTAFWYARARGLPQDLDSLLDLGLVAARIARWEGLEPWQVAEGPYWVHMWPEHVWDQASQGGMPRSAGYDDVHGYSLPHGGQALRDIGY